MKALVAVKRVIDYNVKVRVKTDKSGVETASVKMSQNPFDEVALEAAMRLKEATIVDEIIVVSMGSKNCQEQIRYGLAICSKGTDDKDRGILVETDSELQPLAVAKLLKSLVDKEKPELVIVGKQAIDDDANQTGQMLAGLLGWGQATFVSELTVAEGALKITREIDGGLESLSVKLPAVLTVDLRLNEPRNVALPKIINAKKKKLDTMTPAQLGVDVTPRLVTLKVEEPAKRKAGIKVPDVKTLVAKLKDEAKVI